MKKILVTGGAGFIGSHFIRLLLEKREDFCVNLDALTYAGKLENLKEVEQHPKYRFVHGNICDKDLVAGILKEYDIDIILNFAAESHVDRSIEEPDIFVKTNILGTQTLLECAKNHWQIEGTKYKEGVKFLQISTDEVYGTLGTTGYFKETTPLSPNSPYSASKASGDLLVRAYFETFSLPVHITRCSNNYGPNQLPEKLIPLMIHHAMVGKNLPVYGDGLQIRDWLHVKDHCTGIIAVLDQGTPGEVYNIGGNNEHTNLSIVKMILKQMGKTEESITFVTDRLGHDRRYAIDSGKIQKELGWSPSYSFEEGLKETVAWYQQ